MKKDLAKSIAAIEIAAITDSANARKVAEKKCRLILKGLKKYETYNYDKRLCRIMGKELTELINFEELSRYDWDISPSQKFRVDLNLQRANVFQTLSTEDFMKKADYFVSLQNKDIEIVTAIDGTGSMEWVIDKIRTDTTKLMGVYSDLAKSMKFGVVIYRDEFEGKPEFLKITSNTKSVLKFLEKVKADGGGDIPEWVLSGIQQAKINGWRSNSVKHLVIIGDAPPKNKNLFKIQEELKSLKGTMGITTHAILCAKGGDEPVQEFKDLSKWGQGAYQLFNKKNHIARAILKASMDPFVHDLFDDFFYAYQRYCL